MTKKNLNFLLISIIIFGLFILISSSSADLPTSSNRCDKTLWEHVYHPSRLKILDNCIELTGTIEKIKKEADGDLHINLKPDSKYSNVINDANKQYQYGNLVMEPVCINKPTQESAKEACDSFQFKMDVPVEGSRVRVIGSYVEDKEHHNWRELHPLSKIENIP